MMHRLFSRFICGTTCTSTTEEPKETEEPDYTNINMTEVKPFIPPISSGFVVKVYDGDTITIISKLPYKESSLYKFSVRLNGIDCPEIKGETLKEKQCAQLAKEELSKLILNKNVILKDLKTEKYGRILAEVYLDDLHLNQYMLDKKLAVKYDGGTKIKAF
jgi:endonuclease YncB( thermonuclease family)